MAEKSQMEKIALVLSVLLFAGIYLAGLVMGVQEMANRASVRGSAPAAGGAG